MISLQNQIIKNPDYIVTILNKLGHSFIDDKGKYITFANIDGDNKGACSILKSNLQYQNFSHGKSGNIFTLVMDDRHIDFKSALEWIATKLGILTDNYSAKNIKFPFNAFYKLLIKDNQNGIDLPVYSNSLLPEADGLSKKFLDDGIALNVQEKYGVRFDHEENAILIPIYDCYGRLVGCKARNNSDDDYNHRWWAYLNYSKTSVVYGWNFNYRAIIKHKLVVVVESEKSVLQAISFGCNLCVAVAGHNISETQCRLIKGLMAEKIIIGFDEGIDEDEIEFEAKKLKITNSLFENKVGYIWDDCSVRCGGAKESPTDLGKDAFKDLIKNYVRWIE